MSILSIVLELPPAPADLVLDGLALAALSALSAAAFLRIAVFGPPGGERLRPLVTLPTVEGVEGEEGLGDDCIENVSRYYDNLLREIMLSAEFPQFESSLLYQKGS